jgi:carboxymethylenebutenolidase
MRRPSILLRPALGALPVLLLLGPLRAGAAPASVDTSRVRLAEGTEALVLQPPGRATASVIVVHEWWGLNAQIRALGRQLAEQGYVVVIPDLYRGRVADDPERAHVLSRGLDPDTALAALAAAAAWARAVPHTSRPRLAVVGFCMGGGYAQRLALADSGLAAAVMFYGSPVTDSARIARLRVPLQAHFGADDEGIPPRTVAALRAALKSAPVTGEVYVYAGAGHAFMNELRPSYRPDAARQAWARTLAFLEQRLKR